MELLVIVFFGALGCALFIGGLWELFPPIE